MLLNMPFQCHLLFCCKYLRGLAQLCSVLHFAAYWVILWLMLHFELTAALFEERQTILAYV